MLYVTEDSGGKGWRKILPLVVTGVVAPARSGESKSSGMAEPDNVFSLAVPFRLTLTKQRALWRSLLFRLRMAQGFHLPRNAFAKSIGKATENQQSTSALIRSATILLQLTLEETTCRFLQHRISEPGEIPNLPTAFELAQ